MTPEQRLDRIEATIEKLLDLLVGMADGEVAYFERLEGRAHSPQCRADREVLKQIIARDVQAASEANAVWCAKQ